MSLQFILGNSGSGKTTYLFENVVKEAQGNWNKNYLVIVPEQFTMQTQKKLVSLSKNHAIMNIDVLSFDRLAYRIFDELGIDCNKVLEETGKNLVLRKVAKLHEEELSVLRPNMNRMGYINEVKSLLSELMQYHIAPEEIKGYVDKGLSPVLSAKLNDVTVLYEGFLDYVKDHYITSEELLMVLKNVCKDSKILESAVLVLDEFTGFTPIQLELLKELFPIVSEVRVSLTIDAKEDFYHSKGMHELFDMPKKTIERLMETAAFLHIPIEEPIVLSDSASMRFKGKDSLSYLERNLFRAKEKPIAAKDIKIAVEKNPREEMLFVAREIKRLVQEDGYRYKEIAVVSSAVETYGNYVDEVFSTYEIPYFLDATKEVLFHPFIEFIRATLEIIHTNFSYESLMRMFRLGFFPYTDEELDLLDNYLVASGIRGKNRWQKEWTRLPKYPLEELNQIRQKFYESFLAVYQVFTTKHSIAEQINVFYEWIASLGIEGILKKRAAEYQEMGQQAKAKEYEQIYGIVISLFEQYVDLLGEEVLSLEEFEELLDAGLSAAKVATLPPGFDTVTIGDVERTRLGEVKVLFFVGVNDGLIPKASNAGGIISQYERERLKEMDMPLAPSAKEQAFIQKYYLYLNLTKPSDALYLSYAKLDATGKAIRPSYLIHAVTTLFSDIEIIEAAGAKAAYNLSTEQSAKDYLLYGPQDEKWFSLAKTLAKTNPEFVSTLLEANSFFYEDEPISKLVAKAIYGESLKGSVTRLEQYAKCAYGHFLRYGLFLKERETYGFASVDIGNIYHAALERYSKALDSHEKDWFTIEEKERDELAKTSFWEVASDYLFGGEDQKAEETHHLKRMEETFLRTVWALTKQVRMGRFVPSKFEVGFYTEQDLKGRIDRLDFCKEDSNFYVKVIDYKSGNSKLDLIEVYKGTQLQLLTYLDAAMAVAGKEAKSLAVKPGGIFYYNIDDPVIEVAPGDSLEDIEEKNLLSLKPNGLLNSSEEVYRAMDDTFDGTSSVIPLKLKKSGEISLSGSSVATEEEFETLMDYVNMTMNRFKTEIYEGKISINPEDDCKYCPYDSICGIHGNLPGLCERKRKTPSKKEVISQMEIDVAKYRGVENGKD